MSLHNVHKMNFHRFMFSLDVKDNTGQTTNIDLFLYAHLINTLCKQYINTVWSPTLECLPVLQWPFIFKYVYVFLNKITLKLKCFINSNIRFVACNIFLTLYSDYYIRIVHSWVSTWANIKAPWRLKWLRNGYIRDSHWAIPTCGGEVLHRIHPWGHETLVTARVR